MSQAIWNWGILGPGHIAGVFAAALSGVETARLKAVGSRSLKRAEDFAAKYQFETAYGSYAALAADPAVDVVYISSPMSCHAEHIRLCLENGKHVLCEKTVTLNAAQWKELACLAREKQLFLMEAMWTKCLPAFQQAVKWVQEGRIGTVRLVKAEMSLVLRDPNPRLISRELGGGALLDVGVYPLAVATACLGYRPQEVKTCAYIGRTGVDYDAAILLQYPDAYAALTIGFDLECRNDAIVVGETGRIVFDPEFWRAESVKLYDRNGGILDVFCQPHPINGYEYEISEVHRALDAGRLESRLIPQRDTLATMRLLDACRAQWGLYYDEETLKSSGNE